MRNLKEVLYGQVAFQILKEGFESGLLNYLAFQGETDIDKITENFPDYNKSITERLLNSMVALNLLDKAGCIYSVPNRYKESYLDESDKCLKNYVNHLSSYTRKSLDKLHSVVKGEELEEKDTFSEIYSTDEGVEGFLNSMWGISSKDTTCLITKEGFGKYEKLVDVGGASGQFILECLKHNRIEEGVVFDLPQVEKFFQKKVKLYNLNNKISFCAGDFFKDNYPEADAYSFGYILSDWNDEQCKYLLKKAYSQLSEGGSILILEKLFEESKVEPYETVIMDLCMLVETEGRHRTFNEYKSLLEESGYSEIRLVLSSGEKHLIKGRKKSNE